MRIANTTSTKEGVKKKKKEKEKGDLYDANSQAKKFPEQEDGFP